MSHGGRKHVFLVDADSNEEAARKLKEELAWTEKLLMFACYVNCEVASRAITECFEELFQRPDIYRQKVKLLANQSRKALYKTIQDILAHGEAEFLDNFSANFCNDVQGDVMKLRLSIEHEMNKAKMKDARLYSYVNTAFVMLQYCLRSYDKLMEELLAKYKHDFSPLYTVFCPVKASSLWDSMYLELFKLDKRTYDIDLSENTTCRLALDVIDHKLLNPQLIHDNIVKAYKELPEEKRKAEIDEKLLGNGKEA